MAAHHKIKYLRRRVRLAEMQSNSQSSGPADQAARAGRMLSHWQMMLNMRENVLSRRQSNRTAKNG